MNTSTPSAEQRPPENHLSKSVFSNASWLAGEKIAQTGASFFVGVWLARYLGPSDYGLLAYAITFATFITTLAALGLNPIVLRDLTKHEDVHATLGTAFLLQFFAGIFCYTASLLIASRDPTNSGVLLWAMACTGTSVLLGAFKVIESWFQSRSESRFPVYVSGIAIATSTVSKAACMLAGCSLKALALIFALENFVAVCGLVTVFHRRGEQISRWHWNAARARRLLVSSWPLLVSSVMILIYIRTDQILIKRYLGSTALGHYSIATRLTDTWYFIPLAISTAAFPKISQLRTSDNAKYLAEFQRLCRIVVTLGIGVAVPLSFSAPLVVKILFGASYLPSAAVLQIYVWTIVFVFLGTVSSQWFIHENLQFYSLVRNSLGAILNLMLNIALIPRWGLIGSAFATFSAVFVASYAANSLSPKTRSLFNLHTRAIVEALKGEGLRDVYRILLLRLSSKAARAQRR